MLGDLNVAEPRALIGFAGPRVIQQTVRETLPEGFQRSEFLLDHGALDLIVDRRDMRERLGSVLRLLMRQPAAVAQPATALPIEISGACARSPTGSSNNRIPSECHRSHAESRAGSGAPSRPADARLPRGHRGGTNGKGSTVAFLDALLRAPACALADSLLRISPATTSASVSTAWRRAMRASSLRSNASTRRAATSR